MRSLAKKNVSKSHRANRTKGIYSIMCALSLFFILILLNKQLTNLLISLSAFDFFPGPDLSVDNAYVRHHNALVYGGMGVILFYLLSSIGYFLLDANAQASQLIRYGYLTTKLLRWAAFLIFFDIVLQNLASTGASLSKFPIRYQTIGALIGIETYILYTFLSQRQGIDHE